MKVNMSNANASMNMDEEINEGLDLSKEEVAENVLGVLNAQQEMNPPINDSILRPTHTDNDDIAKHLEFSCPRSLERKQQQQHPLG